MRKRKTKPAESVARKLVRQRKGEFAQWAGSIPWPAGATTKVKRILFKLGKESETLKKKAMQSLKNEAMPPEEAANLLKAVFSINSLTPSTKSTVIKILARKAGEKAVPLLYGYKKEDRAFEFKQAITETLAEMGHRPSIAQLVRLLSSKYSRDAVHPFRPRGLVYISPILNTAFAIAPEKSQARMKRAQKFFKELNDPAKESLLLLYLALNPKELAKLPPNFKGKKHRHNIDYFVNLRTGAGESGIEELVKILKLGRRNLIR